MGLLFGACLVVFDCFALSGLLICYVFVFGCLVV